MDELKDFPDCGFIFERESQWYNVPEDAHPVVLEHRYKDGPWRHFTLLVKGELDIEKLYPKGEGWELRRVAGGLK